MEKYQINLKGYQNHLEVDYVRVKGQIKNLVGLIL